MESSDLLSTALDASGIKPDNDEAGLNEKNRDMSNNTPKNIHHNFMTMPQLPNQWPGSYPYPMMGYQFPFMEKNLMMSPSAEMFANAAMGMALQNQMLNGYPAMPYGFKDINPYLNGDSIFRAMMMQPDIPHVTEEADEDEEELGRAETFADYMPLKLKIGSRHPDPVVETSSLSSVEPPEISYHLSIPEEVIDNGLLSALQLEAITYACQAHETIMNDGTRGGFLIGDGAGVGKGRTVAAIIFENYLLGRKRAIWLSVSSDLKYDAERDLSDIGAKIEVHSLNKLKYAKISSKANGNIKKGVIFSTYSSLIGESQSAGKYKTRLKQLLQWCSDDFDGCIVFDECHKAKNLCPVGASRPTKTGLAVLELQTKLPKARIVYASATGASEPKNMAYMTRLHLWGEGTPFREFSDFISVVEKRGVGAMELLAMEMKLNGLYIARSLSFSGVTFSIDEIALADDFVQMYNEAVKLWVEARAKFAEAAELMQGDPRTKKSIWAMYWSSHQRFFKYLCIASKVNRTVQLAREAIKNGKCCVIGLQSTGEARTLESLEDFGGELNDFVSTAKGVFLSLVEKHFPAPNRKKALSYLGISSPNRSSSVSPTPTTSSCDIRKPLRRATQGVKRYQDYKMSDESSDEYIASGGSDFEPTDESFAESDDDNAKGENFSNTDSERDDFNPFGESDSDDPWASRKNKVERETSKKRKNAVNHKIKKHKKSSLSKPLPKLDACEKASAMKADLLQKIEKLGDILPPNTLDYLIDELGGPDCVAEMTGRKGRVVSNSSGAIKYESRSENDVPLETLNMTEKERFMNGEKHIAIISEAASSGISLQSDRRVKNQARRVHLTLELPWSADRAIQQFGRTHRSNQVNAPEYIFLISDLAGERRFASTVAKRLESLGALTHGDRRATESRDLSQFNIDNKYGRAALEEMFRAVMEYQTPLVPPPADYKGNFFYDIRKALIGVAIITEDPINGIQMLDKDHNNMSKLLNRILGLPVDLQNRFYKYFNDTLDAVIAQAKKSGRYDMGILDIGTGSEVKRIKCEEFLLKTVNGTTRTELHTVLIERGLSFEAAVEKFAACTDVDEGFYLSTQTRNNKKTAILAVVDTNNRSKRSSDKILRIYRPNTGLQVKLESVEEIKSKYHKSTKEDVEEHWKTNFDASLTQCSHLFWYGQCRRRTMHLVCEVGLRERQYYVLSGSVLSVWSKIESVLSAHHGSHNAKLQVVRLKIEENKRIVGCLIPSNVVETLRKVLADDGSNDQEDY